MQVAIKKERKRLCKAKAPCKAPARPRWTVRGRRQGSLVLARDMHAMHEAMSTHHPSRTRTASLAVVARAHRPCASVRCPSSCRASEAEPPPPCPMQAHGHGARHTAHAEGLIVRLVDRPLWAQIALGSTCASIWAFRLPHRI